jgi:acetylornithine deacetylase/succinyl-diaminopimelate desuccinylase-like protein
VQRYSITAHTAGGHSWVNFGQPSAIHELARFITRLEDLPVSRAGSPGVPRSSYNVGLIQGGSSVNTIAAQAWLELDLRSEDEQHLQTVVQQVEALIRQSSRTGERAVTFSLQSIGSRPAGCIAVDHPLVQAAQAAVTRQGITPRLDIGSTDANLPLSCGYPAICIGLTRGGGAHSLSEYIEIAPLVHGLAQLEMLVRAVDEFS